MRYRGEVCSKRLGFTGVGPWTEDASEAKEWAEQQADDGLRAGVSDVKFRVEIDEEDENDA